MKTGKLPASYDPRDLRFADYLSVNVLPKIPGSFGHDATIATSGWGMLGNDTVGDCVLAGGGHETMLWTRERYEVYAEFTDTGVISDYSAITGYNPADPATDVGTDVREALLYRKKIGLIDSQGKRHKIGAFAAIEPGHWDHVLAAVYLFGVVGIGIQFPESAMDQFDTGKGWSVVAGARVDGGHYVPVVARRGTLHLVTWGREIGMTKGFFEKYCDEAWAILSPEHLDPKSGKSPEGFDTAQLTSDLKLTA